MPSTHFLSSWGWVGDRTSDYSNLHDFTYPLKCQQLNYHHHNFIYKRSWQNATMTCNEQLVTHTHTHTHTRLMALCPGLPGWAGTRKVKPIWILLEQETVSGSGISWAICKSAPRSRQITMPTLHHSGFLQAGCPSCRPTNSVKALKAQLVSLGNYCGQLVRERERERESDNEILGMIVFVRGRNLCRNDAYCSAMRCVYVCMVQGGLDCWTSRGKFSELSKLLR